MSPENNNDPENDTAIDAPVATEALNENPSGDHTMAMLCHLLSFLGLLGIPLGNILGPLLLWLIKKDGDPLVDATGKEVLNFQLSVMIYGLLCVLLVFAFGLGIILALILLILVIIYTIIGAIKANEGLLYRYPYTLRFIK